MQNDSNAAGLDIPGVVQCNKTYPDAFPAEEMQQLSGLSDQRLAEIHKLVGEEKDRRDRLINANWFHARLTDLQSCLGVKLTFTKVRRTKDAFVVDKDCEHIMMRLASKLPEFLTKASNQTPLRVLLFLSNIATNQDGIFVFLGDQDVEPLCLMNGGLAQYLSCFTMTQDTLSLKDPVPSLPKDNDQIKKFASPFWMNQIHLQQAKHILDRVTDSDALVRFCVATIQKQLPLAEEELAATAAPSLSQ